MCTFDNHVSATKNVTVVTYKVQEFLPHMEILLNNEKNITSDQ